MGPPFPRRCAGPGGADAGQKDMGLGSNQPAREPRGGRQKLRRRISTAAGDLLRAHGSLSTSGHLRRAGQGGPGAVRTADASTWDEGRGRPPSAVGQRHWRRPRTSEAGTELCGHRTRTATATEGREAPAGSPRRLRRALLAPGFWTFRSPELLEKKRSLSEAPVCGPLLRHPQEVSTDLFQSHEEGT